MTIEEIEDHILTKYDPAIINSQPSTEKELLNIYYFYTDILFQYVRNYTERLVNPITNEIRALFGHLAEYRISDQRSTKIDLEKAYGHLRRINLDLMKILCDEFDRSFSKIQKSQSHYDLRNMEKDYSLTFGEKYFKAKKLYIYAQQQERLGCDSHTHNVYDLYYQAAKEYIELKRYYQKYKNDIIWIKTKTTISNVFFILVAVAGATSTILKFIFENFSS